MGYLSLQDIDLVLTQYFKGTYSNTGGRKSLKVGGVSIYDLS